MPGRTTGLSHRQDPIPPWDGERCQFRVVDGITACGDLSRWMVVMNDFDQIPESSGSGLRCALRRRTGDGLEVCSCRPNRRELGRSLWLMKAGVAATLLAPGVRAAHPLCFAKFHPTTERHFVLSRRPCVRAGLWAADLQNRADSVDDQTVRDTDHHAAVEFDFSTSSRSACNQSSMSYPSWRPRSQ